MGYFTALLSSDVSSSLRRSTIFSSLRIGRLRPIFFRCSGVGVREKENQEESFQGRAHEEPTSSQFFFDPEQLVVFGSPLTSRWRARFDEEALLGRS